MTLPILDLGPGHYDDLSIVEDIEGQAIQLVDWRKEHKTSPYVVIRGVPGHTILNVPLELYGPRPYLADFECPWIRLENPHECHLYRLNLRPAAGETGLSIVCTQNGLPTSPAEVWPPWSVVPRGAKCSRSVIDVDITGDGNGIELINYVSDDFKQGWRDLHGFRAVNSFANHTLISGRITVKGQGAYFERWKRITGHNWHIDAQPQAGLDIGPECARVVWYGPAYCEQAGKHGEPVITGDVSVLELIGWSEQETERALLGG